MKFFGIHFVPFNEPLQRKLETFWPGFWFVMFIFGFFIFYLPLVYLCFTPFWWVFALTVIWIYLDRKTPERGGRPIKWTQNWSSWRYLPLYYNSELLFDDQFKLNPNRNYLFCAFPHGIIPMGLFSNVIIKPSPFRKLYPYLDVKLAILNTNFFVPIIREIWLGINLISCSAKSLTYVLSKSEGGTVINLMVGGAEEASYSRPGRYKFVVKKRKGFVKIALKTGTSLVPLITFGENDSYEQIENSCLLRFQLRIKKYVGFVPIVFNGRGLFQYSFGVFPRKRKMITVLGKPIDFQKVENPTQQQIDDLHAEFTKKLEELFEKFKHKVLKNPADTQLELC